MEVQGERSLISGMVKMEVSSNNDSMAELRAAFSDVRIESQPTMEVVKLFSQYFLFILKYCVPRLPPTCPTQNTCWRDQVRRIIETQSSFLPCPVTLYTFSFLLRSIDLVKDLILMKYILLNIIVGYYNNMYTWVSFWGTHIQICI